MRREPPPHATRGNNGKKDNQTPALKARPSVTSRGKDNRKMQTTNSANSSDGGGKKQQNIRATRRRINKEYNKQETSKKDGVKNNRKEHFLKILWFLSQIWILALWSHICLLYGHLLNDHIIDHAIFHHKVSQWIHY